MIRPWRRRDQGTSHISPDASRDTRAVTSMDLSVYRVEPLRHCSGSTRPCTFALDLPIGCRASPNRFRINNEASRRTACRAVCTGDVLPGCTARG